MNRFFQALIALSGLVITGLLGVQTLTTTNRQADLAASENKYTLIGLFSDQIYAALDRCDTDLALIAVDAANELAENHDETQYLEYASLALDKLDECGGVTETEEVDGPNSGSSGIGSSGTGSSSTGSAAETPAPPPAPGAVSQPGPTTPRPSPPPEPQQQQQVAVDINPVRNLELRQEEGAITKGSVSQRAGGPAIRWYAVLASYKAGSEEPYAVDDIKEFRDLIAASKTPDLALQVYRTSQSDHYAIVLAPADGSREAARELASTARSMGLSRDSFVQEDRRWTRCDQPDTVQGLQACTRIQPPAKR